MKSQIWKAIKFIVIMTVLPESFIRFLLLASQDIF